MINKCSICKSRFTWECEDEIETGRTSCSEFDLDLNALKKEDRDHVKKLVLAYLMTKEL